MAKLVICNSCGAQFGNDHPKCPYCGTMNYEGAEKEYFEKLEDIREDVEELNAVPMQETKAELKKQGKFIRKIVTIVVVLALIFGGIIFLQERSYERDNKADFIWQENNYPIMDELYANGEYEELMAFYMQAAEGDYFSFYNFMMEKHVPSYDSAYEQYDQVENLISQYIYFYDYIMKAYMEEDVSYRTNLCKYATDTLEYFYENLDPERYSYYENADSEENLSAIADLKAKVEMLLVTYGGILPEDAAQFEHYTSAKRAILLEEGMLNVK